MHGTIAARSAGSCTDRPPPSAVEIDVNGTRVICDRAGVLWLPASRALVVSDLHLEKGRGARAAWHAAAALRHRRNARQAGGGHCPL